MLCRRRLHMRLLRGLRLRHRRPGLRGRLHVLRRRRLHVLLLLRRRLHVLLLWRRLLRLRRRRFRGRGRRGPLRRRCLRRRLARLLFLRFLLLLLREQQRAVLDGACRERLAERKSRDNRSGKQDLLRPCHVWLFLRVVRQTRVARTGTTGGRQWCAPMMTKK
jgi:hypothetical protein